MKNKIILLLPLIYMGIFISIHSCVIPFQVNNEPPIPEEDPISITRDAQTFDTKVKNLSVIKTLYPDVDKVTINDVITEKVSAWTRIENEWINVYQYRSPDKHEIVQISVKENKTGKVRIYTLGIKSDFHESTLSIIQEP